MHLQVNSTTKHTKKSSIELHSDTISMTLSDYSETMYPKGDEGGYVAVATKNHREGWNQQVVSISKWTSIVQLDTNCYISMNTFYRPERRVRSVRHLNAFFIDIDYYNTGISKEDVLHAIEFYINTDRIVEPTFVIDSGRGLYAIWKIEDVPGRYKHTKSLYGHIQQYIFELFKDYGADANSKDIARVLRVPNSLHTKTNRRVKVIYFNPDAHYTMSMFQQFVDPFEIYINKDCKKARNKPVSRSKRKSNIKQLFNIYTLYKARANDLELLCKLRNYDLKGMRNNILFIYHYFMMHIHRNEQVALYKTLNLNDRFIDPLTKGSVKSYIQSSVRAYYEHLEDKTKGYNYKNETLIDLYNITPEEQEQLETIVSRREKYDRNNKRRTPRNEEGLTPRQAKKKETINQVKALHEQGLKQVEISKELGLSSGRISQLLKEIKKV